MHIDSGRNLITICSQLSISPSARVSRPVSAQCLPVSRSPRYGTSPTHPSPKPCAPPRSEPSAVVWAPAGRGFSIVEGEPPSVARSASSAPPDLRTHLSRCTCALTAALSRELTIKGTYKRLGTPKTSSGARPEPEPDTEPEPETEEGVPMEDAGRKTAPLVAEPAEAPAQPDDVRLDVDAGAPILERTPISVREFTGKAYPLTVDLSTEDVSKLKTKVQAANGASTDAPRLTVEGGDGKPLEDVTQKLTMLDEEKGEVERAAWPAELAMGSAVKQHQINVRGIGVEGWDGTQTGCGTYESEEALERIFQSFGTCVQVAIRHRIEDDANTSWALVTMSDATSVDRALVAPSVMAGTSELQLTRFDPNQTAASTGVMSPDQGGRLHAAACDYLQINPSERTAAQHDLLVAWVQTIPFFRNNVTSGHIFSELAKEMTCRSFAASDTICQQGEIGDKFYVIVGGSVDVSVDGTHVGSRVTGDAFGDQALATQIPSARTATVIAKEHTTVASLDAKVYFGILVAQLKRSRVHHVDADGAARTYVTKKLDSADEQKASGVADRLSRIIFYIQVACVCYAALILLPDSTDVGGTQWTSLAATNESTLLEWGAENITICPRPSICSEGLHQVFWICGARLSAYFMYPALGAVFLTKCHALCTAMASTILNVFIPLADLHHLHARLGHAVALMTVIHAASHIVRWALRGELHMLYSHPAGLSGVIATLCMAPVWFLMGGPEALRKRFPWETRKTAHLLSVVIAISLLWHTTRLRWFMGIIVGIYCLDRLYVNFALTYRIEKPVFRRLQNGVQLSFPHPPNWHKETTGYVNIMIPWVSKTQWHPFSVYGHPQLDDHSSVCINAAGDWTRELHKSIVRPTSRPVWVQGPFASPYEGAVEYDNLLLVASGIGITPALSCLDSHKDQRRVSLLWMCRDPSLIEFFLDIVEFSDDGFALIYYTGKTKLNLPQGLARNVRIIPGRPNIRIVLAEIIQSVEENLDLPPNLLQQSNQFVISHVLSTHEAEAETAENPMLRIERMFLDLVHMGVSTEEILNMFDADDESTGERHSELSVDELHKGLINLNCDMDIEQVEEMHAQLDRSGDGLIDAVEWKQFVDQCCLKRDAPDSVRTIALHAWTNAPQASPETFSGHYSAYLNLSGTTLAVENVCVAMRSQGMKFFFSDLDIRGKGLVDRREIVKGVASAGVKANQEVVDLIIDVLMNGRHEITFKEFSDGFSVLKQTLESQHTAPERARAEPIEYVQMVRTHTHTHSHTHAHTHSHALMLFTLRRASLQLATTLLAESNKLFSCRCKRMA